MKKRNKAVFIPNGEKEEKEEYGTLGSEYHMPLLKVLNKLGGEGKAEIVLEEIEREMELKDVDYEKVPSGAIRWKVNTYYASDHLKNMGFLDKLPYRIWRITEEGRRYYEKNAKGSLRMDKQN